MPIYTKTGDNGETAVYGGRRVLKSDPEPTAYGTIDELTSWIGLLLSQKIKTKDKKTLGIIQQNLYSIMSLLAGAKNINHNLSPTNLELRIDELDQLLPKLSSFIYPRGTTISCYFQIARAVCRRCERVIVSTIKTTRRSDLNQVIPFINRLSDLLFMMGRYYNKNNESKIS